MDEEEEGGEEDATRTYEGGSVLALYCLYSGGVSGWVGGVEALYWRVETTAMGRERERDREGGETGRGDADEEEDGRRATNKGKQKREKREKNEKQPTEQPSKQKR